MYRVTVFLYLLFALTLSLAAQNRSTPAPTPSPQGPPPKLRDLNAPATSAPPVLNNGNSPAATPTPSKTGENDIIKVSTDLVTTPVSVLDRQGRFIPNLKKSDFQIFDNGVQQQITYFQSS